MSKKNAPVATKTLDDFLAEYPSKRAPRTETPWSRLHSRVIAGQPGPWAGLIKDYDSLMLFADQLEQAKTDFPRLMFRVKRQVTVGDAIKYEEDAEVILSNLSGYPLVIEVTDLIGFTRENIEFGYELHSRRMMRSDMAYDHYMVTAGNPWYTARLGRVYKDDAGVWHIEGQPETAFKRRKDAAMGLAEQLMGRWFALDKE